MSTGATRTRPRLGLLGWTCLVGVLAASGCGGGIGKLHPVSGKVTGPVNDGDAVLFQPSAGTKFTKNLTIRGEIKGGSYKMTTDGKDGVPAGTFTVVIAPTPPKAGDIGTMKTGDATAAVPVPTSLKVNPSEVKVPAGPFDLTVSR